MCFFFFLVGEGNNIFEGLLFFLAYVFIFGCWVFVTLLRLSPVAKSGGYSSLPCASFSLQWLFSLRSRDSRLMGFSICSTRAQYV